MYMLNDYVSSGLLSVSVVINDSDSNTMAKIVVSNLRPYQTYSNLLSFHSTGKIQQSSTFRFPGFPFPFVPFQILGNRKYSIFISSDHSFFLCPPVSDNTKIHIMIMYQNINIYLFLFLRIVNKY
jgi:hypothetical protein